MSRAVRLLLAAPLAAAVPAVLGAFAAVPGVPAFNIDYRADCTFTMSVDPGTAITSATAPGPTVPPGTYQLLIAMPNPSSGYTCVTPVLTFTGPGVSTRSVFPGAELDEERIVTLQPSSTYIAQDESAPGTRRVFTTAAAGSSSALVGPSLPDTSKPGATSSDIVGSAVLRYRGKLVASVAAGGNVTLKRSGRAVASLKAGRYDIAVDDATARAGFFVQRGMRKPVMVTGVAFVGDRTKRVALAAGKWSFFATPGRATRFTVVA